MWKFYSGFEEICMHDDNFTVSFPFLENMVKVIVPGLIVDACASHSFVAVVANERIFIAHKDRLHDPLQCLYKKNMLNLEFEPYSWVSVVQPFSQRVITNNWWERKKPSSDVTLTATASTIFLICTIGHTSVLVRLLNETTYLESSEMKPSVIQISEDLVIVMAASGYDHSLFLTSEGVVYVLGTGSRGELGIGLVPRVCELTKLEALEGLNLIAVGAAGWHSAALTDDGDVYLWGWNHRSQLGDKKEKVEFYPSPLDIHLRIVRIALGEHFTALWVNEDEEKPSIIMGSKGIGMPTIRLTYYSETPANEPKILSIFNDYLDEPVI